MQYGPAWKVQLAPPRIGTGALLTAAAPAGRLLASPAIAGRPWLAYLAISLPASPTAWHWKAAWVGLDAMEAAGLVSTGVLLLRRDARASLTAAGTAALLLADAWFDVTTAPPGSGALTSLLMAVLAELPAAALCAGLAIRGLRRPPGGPVGRGQHHRPPFPVEQLPAEIAFQRLDLLRAGRPGDEQAPGRPPEAQLCASHRGAVGG